MIWNLNIFLTPLKVGPVTLENRIALGAFTTSIIDNDPVAGLLNEDSIYFYRSEPREA